MEARLSDSRRAPFWRAALVRMLVVRHPERASPHPRLSIGLTVASFLADPRMLPNDGVKLSLKACIEIKGGSSPSPAPEDAGGCFWDRERGQSFSNVESRRDACEKGAAIDSPQGCQKR